MSCGIHTRCKMFISVHQCIRNSFITNKEIFLRRKFNTLRKPLRPVSLISISHSSIKVVSIFHGQSGSNVFSKNHKVFPLACYSDSNDLKPQVDKKKKEGIYKRFKTMFKEYWYVLVPVHIVTSCFWFGSFYYMAASGVDIPLLMENLGAPESWISKFKDTKAGNIVLAYTLYKVVTPIRYTVTIGGTTLSINHLKKWGWIKPVPSSEKLKKLYEGQKDVLQDLKTGYQDKMQVTKNEFLKTKNEMKKQLGMAKEEFHKSMSAMRNDIKDGVKGGAEEWKIISKTFAREAKEALINSKKKRND